MHSFIPDIQYDSEFMAFIVMIGSFDSIHPSDTTLDLMITLDSTNCLLFPILNVIHSILMSF